MRALLFSLGVTKILLILLGGSFTIDAVGRAVSHGLTGEDLFDQRGLVRPPALSLGPGALEALDHGRRGLDVDLFV